MPLSTFTPRQKPGGYVEQVFTTSVKTPVVPTMPAVAVGPLILVQDPTVVATKYTGTSETVILPNFEAGAKVKASSVNISLSNIEVGLLGISEQLDGTVPAVTVPDPHARRFLDATGKTGLFFGVKAGDIAEVTENITNGVAGVVDATDLFTLTQSGSFVNVNPGDTILVADPVTSIEITTQVLQVTAGGNAVVVADELLATNNLVWTITRLIKALVKAVPSDTRLELNKELSVSGSNVNIFKIKRMLLATGASSSSQPLALGAQAVGTSSYTLATTNSTNDSVSIVGDLRISGFNLFNAYPIVNLSSLQLEVDTTTTTLKNAAGASEPVVFASILSVNDIVLVGASATRYKVVSINASTNKVTFNSSLGAAADPVTALTIPEKAKLITNSSISIGYRALKTAKANQLIEIPTKDLVNTYAGPYHVENPLGIACTVMAANTDTAIYFMPIESEDEVGFLKALAKLESQDVYNVCLLSQSITIQGYGKSHVDGMSTALRGKWRVLWANLAEPTEAISSVFKGGSLQVDVTITSGAVVSGSTVFFYDAKQNFNDLLSIGDYIKIESQDNVASTLPSTNSTETTVGTVTTYSRIYRVLEIINASKIKLETVPYMGSDAVYSNVAVSSLVTEAGVSYIGQYTAIKALTVAEQALYIANIAASFADRRVLLISNGESVISIDSLPHTLPGYYIAAALAGLSSGTLQHQPLTNISITGVLGVRGGSDKYDETLQGLIAAGGGWLVVQTEKDKSLPYTWQQLSTSQGGWKEQEFSITKNVDEVSKALVGQERDLWGKNNVNEVTIAAFQTNAVSVLDRRKTTTYNGRDGSYLGAPLTAYSFSGVTQDTLIPGVVYADISLEPASPLNTGLIRLII